MMRTSFFCVSDGLTPAGDAAQHHHLHVKCSAGTLYWHDPSQSQRPGQSQTEVIRQVIHDPAQRRSPCSSTHHDQHAVSTLLFLAIN